MARMDELNVSETGIKWLFMPWQPLVASDLAVLTAVEESLLNGLDTTLIIHTCQFVTNVMLQDFPAEVFIQRPAIVSILQALLEQSTNDDAKISQAVIKMLYKLTRSLRYRIYYYCDPAIVNKRPNVILGQSEVSWTYESSLDDRETPEGGVPEANYQAYQQQCTGSRDSPEMVGTNIDDRLLRRQQMTIPFYCTETLKNVLTLFSRIPQDSSPLKIVKNILELSSELVNLLIISLKPSIWLCNDTISLSVSENVKSLMTLLSELIDYFGPSEIDFHRITCLHVVCLVEKVLSNLVPLELADVVVPKNLKISIARTLMDAPMFLINRGLNSILEQYTRQFNDTETTEFLRLFDETRFVSISLEAAITVMNDGPNNLRSNAETLKLMSTAKSSLFYHKSLPLVKKILTFLQEVYVLLEEEEKGIANKLILDLLSNEDEDIRSAAYEECRRLIRLALGVNAQHIGKFTLIKVAFLLDPKIITEIVCHGVAGEDETIKNLAEDILVYILKGKIHMGEEGWRKFVEESLIHVMGLLQCIAATDSQLGRCVTKMLDPDVYESINIPHIEVMKGNSRLLFSSDSGLREEAVCRLIFLLGREKDSSEKLPRLSSLHGLPLSSLCIIERSPRGFKRSEGNYQTSSLLSVLELIKTSDVEPKIRKSALVQMSVMLTDACLHKLFIRENGLPLILDIMNKALIEREYSNYPDSVIPLLSILKCLASTQSSVRHDLSVRPEVYSNILRSLFLFPNNESVKIEASQLLCLLLYSEHIKMPTTIRDDESNLVSLPHVVATRMRLPTNCKSHWKTSTRAETNNSRAKIDDPMAVSFLRQFWYWQTADCREELAENFNDTNNHDVPLNLRVTELEIFKLRHTSVYYCAREQLVNIQNSTMHGQVTDALDYLTMYIKLWKISQRNDDDVDKFKKLPWEQSFVRFLLSQPTNREDCDLFVDVINFLYVYINTEINGENGDWLCKIIRKNVTRSLSDLIGATNTDNREIHEAVLKLVRSASAIEDVRCIDNISDEDSWISFIELIVSNLCFGDQSNSQQQEKQQHFYNLAYLDWLLRCLTYLTSKSHWHNHKYLMVSLGNALIELIVSFYGAGTVSFMGLSITRNSIICLNHLVHEMQKTWGKNEWINYWYHEDRILSWLPMLWRNRDPLVRASAFQLLSALTRMEHTAYQLLKSIALAPSELCHTLLRYFTNREECCIVREQACTALVNLVRNSKKPSFQYVDSLKPNALIIYIEQSNIYYEISVLCSNVYLRTTLEPEQRETHCTKSENSGTLEEEEDSHRRFVVTPTLISVTCTLLNNLIIVGGSDVAKHMYEQSLDKYFLGCFGAIPTLDGVSEKKSLAQYCDILEMYVSLCSLMTNCVTHCQEFSTVANFSSETLCLLLEYLDKENYLNEEERVEYLRKSLTTEVYNFLSILSLTENGQQHMEAIITSAELSGPEKILVSICQSMKDSKNELRMAAIGCLAFLLSLEVRRTSEEIDNDRGGKKIVATELSMSAILDNCLVTSSDFIGAEDYELRKVLSSLNRISVARNSANPIGSKEREDEEKIHLGSEISKVLIHLFIAYNYAKSTQESFNISRDKDIVVGALSNLLCVSNEAKKTALAENLGETCMMILKELHTEFTLQPYQINKTKGNREKKVYPLLNETKRVLDLLMNFMYNSAEIKERLAKAGLADYLHKLWAWISLDDRTLTSALELLATFTTKCTEGTHSLTMTNAIHGTGLRRSPNTTSLIHTIINLICREIEKAGRKFDNQKIHFAFHVLRNAIHVHECRVVISKSDLLQLLGKIHPTSTRRAKPWPLLEVYCLEFFNDFTFYEEGQICVAKATEGVDVLIELARSNTPATRLLAISTLRNLVFHPANRARLLASAGFMNLLRSTFEAGTFNEIGIIGSILWSLVANNQKGKLTIRSAGFSRSIQEVIGRLSLLNMAEDKQRQDLAKILHYVVRMLSSSEGQSSTEFD